MSTNSFFLRLLAIASRDSAPPLPPATSATPPLGENQDSVGLTAVGEAASMSDAVKRQQVTVVGGGPAGALMALYLSRSSGIEVDLFEAFEEGKIAGATSRSWNVIIFERGCAALEEGGFDVVKESGDLVITVGGRVRHDAAEKLGVGFALGSKSICRGDLAMALLKKAQQSPNVRVHFGCAFSTMDEERGVATFERGNGEIFECSFDMLVGADGVNSRVRRTLQDHSPGFTVRQSQGSMAYKIVNIPIMDMVDAEESWKTCIHTSYSKASSVVGSPQSDGVVSAAVILPTEGTKSFEELMKTPQDVRDFFGNNHPGLFGPQGPNKEVAKRFLEQRSRRLRTIYCSQLALGNVVLIGDAAHAMEASLGQGVNSAFEDCQVLAQVMAAEAGKTGLSQVCDVQKALEDYSKLRLEDAHAVCALSEMGVVFNTKKILVAQFIVTVILNKTLGRLMPQVFPSPSLFQVNRKNVRYRAIIGAMKREASVANGVLFGGMVLVVAGVARRAMARV